MKRFFVPLDPNGPSDSWVTAGQIAAHLNLETQTVLKWVKQGKFPQADIRTSRRFQRWRLATVKAALSRIGYLPEGPEKAAAAAA
jgi:hypothetical protein